VSELVYGVVWCGVVWCGVVWSTQTKVLLLEGSDGCFPVFCEKMIFVC